MYSKGKIVKVFYSVDIFGKIVKVCIVNILYSKGVL
jgi:hypothetical protein